MPKFETGGEFWPTVHNSTVFSLVLMHVIAVGIFGLKKLPLAAGLTLPLPILTLLFNEYCQKRFLPIFKQFPAEVPLMFMTNDELHSHNIRYYFLFSKELLLLMKQWNKYTPGHDTHAGNNLRKWKWEHNHMCRVMLVVSKTDTCQISYMTLIWSVGAKREDLVLFFNYVFF